MIASFYTLYFDVRGIENGKTLLPDCWFDIATVVATYSTYHSQWLYEHHVSVITSSHDQAINLTANDWHQFLVLRDQLPFDEVINYFLNKPEDYSHE